ADRTHGLGRSPSPLHRVLHGHEHADADADEHADADAVSAGGPL
ncbi:MAG: hypothetical protein AVDCRST_MAG42-1282, partial [uncultured Chthoniobacterales bacterium]